MKINILLPSLNMSGGIRVIAIYAKWLQDKGHDVRLFSHRPTRPTPRQVASSILKKRRLPKIDNSSHFDGLNIPHTLFKCGHEISESDLPDADVLVATWWETAEWAGKISPTKGAKVYFVQHHELFDYVPRTRCEATYRLPLKKIVVAQWLADVMATQYGDTNCTVIPNAVDHSIFHANQRSKQSRFTIGTLHHNAAFKGFDVAADILRKLKEEYPECRVLIIGSTQPDAAVQAELGAEVFQNPPQAQLASLYASCDAWLTTSRTEGFNLMAMEAMACRTPVISTRTGWPIDAIRDGQNGFLIDIDNVAQGVDACQKIAEMSATDWEALSQGAYQTVQDISWDSSCKLFEAELQRAATNGPRYRIDGMLFSQ